MAEELKTAQTNEVFDTEVDSNADIDNKLADSANEAEFTDTVAEEQDATEPSKTSQEQNSENARRRREEERQKELRTAREQAIIETLKGKNPYTDEEIKDSADVEEYLIMSDIEAKGGDPLTDFSKFQKAKEKEKIAQKVQDEKKEEWYINDREVFTTKHPNVNFNELIKDEQFKVFSSGKIGTQSLSEIYDGFIKIVSDYEKKSKQMAQQLLANQKASPGALASPNVNDSAYFTKEQVQKMTQKEVKENYDKIRTSMSKWNN